MCLDDWLGIVFGVCFVLLFGFVGDVVELVLLMVVGVF